MKELRLTEIESRFADIIWNCEPIPSPELVKICEKELKWKKSTTYTMLKRLEAKELFVNNKGIVSSMLKRDEFYAEQSKKYVNETFSGSLPKFLAAFTHNSKLSYKEIEEIQKLINEHKEG